MKVQGLPPWPTNVFAETKKKKSEKSVTACASGSSTNFKQLSLVQYTNTINIVHRNTSLSDWTWYSIYYITVIQHRLYFCGCRYVFICRVITGDLCVACASETRVQKTLLSVLSFALLMERRETDSPRSSVHSAPVMLISVYWDQAEGSAFEFSLIADHLRADRHINNKQWDVYALTVESPELNYSFSPSSLPG